MRLDNSEWWNKSGWWKMCFFAHANHLCLHGTIDRFQDARSRSHRNARRLDQMNRGSSELLLHLQDFVVQMHPHTNLGRSCTCHCGSARPRRGAGQHPRKSCILTDGHGQYHHDSKQSQSVPADTSQAAISHFCPLVRFFCTSQLL